MPWTHIILHHSLTADGIVVNSSAIRRYHIEHNGWNDIGYHFLVEKATRRNDYEVILGRTLDKPGAHTKGMNRCAIGICIVGNYDLVSPEPEMFERLVPVLKWLRKEYKIPLDNIKGHRDYANKSCPGDNFSVEEVINFLRK